MDPCLFWKTYLDASLPDPSEELSDADLKKLVNHLTACESCGDAAMQSFEVLERMLADPESIRLTDDPVAIDRAFYLNILIMMFVDVPT